MILNIKGLFVVTMCFMLSTMDAMITHELIKKNNNRRKIVKMYYNNNAFRGKMHYYPKQPNKQKLNAYFIKEKKNNEIETAQKIAALSQVFNKKQKENRQHNSTNTSHDKQKYVQEEIPVFHILGFITGVYAVYKVISELKEIKERDLETTAIYKSYPLLIEKAQKDFNLDENLKHIFGITFNEFEKLFEEEIGLSLKDFMVYMMKEKTYGKMTIEELLLVLQEKLAADPEARKTLINMSKKLFLFNEVDKKSPALIKYLGLTDPLSTKYAESFCSYLLSPQCVAFAKKIDEYCGDDIQNIRNIHDISNYLITSFVTGSIMNLTIMSVLKRGPLKTFLLTPTPFIPVYASIELYNYLKNSLSTNTKEILKEFLFDTYEYYLKEFLFDTCQYYLLDGDISDTLAKEDLPINMLFDSYLYYVNQIKNDFKNNFGPQLSKEINLYLKENPSDKEKLKEIIFEKLDPELPKKRDLLSNKLRMPVHPEKNKINSVLQHIVRYPNKKFDIPTEVPMNGLLKN